MRISDDLLKSVVFLGFPTDEPGKGGIDCFGTAFLLRYEGFPHLVTCRHIAEFIGQSPFLIRLNRHMRLGGAVNVPVDMLRWYYHSDPNVDVAIVPFLFPNPQNQYDHVYIDERNAMWSRPRLIDNIGNGDFCYTLGLFRVLAGTNRNQPVVHFGTVARMSRHNEDEPIPIIDWRDPARRRTLMMDRAFLVQSQSLGGLSGAPVFVRPTLHQSANLDPPDVLGDIVVARRKVFLLGMWQGAWDAPAGEVLTAERGGMRVPVGMGVVVPIDQIIGTLEGEELKKERERMIATAHVPNAAVPDVASIARPQAVDPPATGANPTHREDFTRLVGAAARKREQED
ncbi:MAG: hypothetical protein WB868_16405 [Xanthobacteraceae bacterium]